MLILLDLILIDKLSISYEIWIVLKIILVRFDIFFEQNGLF